MYKVTGQFPWSSLKETDRGMSAELNVGIGASECVGGGGGGIRLRVSTQTHEERLLMKV